jgi:hypothetical protein
MKTMRRWPGWCQAGLGLTLLALGGCQTETVGMCLPWSRWRDHSAQAVVSVPKPPPQCETESPEGVRVAVAPRQN